MKINLELLTNQANGLGQLLFAEYGTFHRLEINL